MTPMNAESLSLQSCSDQSRTSATWEVVWDDVIRTLDAVNCVSNLSCLLVDMYDERVYYKTESLIYVDEATEGDIQRTSENPYWSLVSKDVLQKLRDIREAYVAMFGVPGPGSLGRHVCVIDYPIVIRGHVFYINQMATPFALKGNNGSKDVIMLTIRPSAKTEMCADVILSGGVWWKYDFERGEFIEYSKSIALTKTEKIILQRAMKGMTNEEIAKDLFISVCTVKTHRNNVFKKLNASNMTEVLVLARNYKLI